MQCLYPEDTPAFGLLPPNETPMSTPGSLRSLGSQKQSDRPPILERALDVQALLPEVPRNRAEKQVARYLKRLPPEPVVKLYWDASAGVESRAKPVGDLERYDMMIARCNQAKGKEVRGR